jgi:hypothetical protein
LEAIVNITVQVPDEHIAAALRFGLEVGIGYWCSAADVYPGSASIDVSIDPDMAPYYYPLLDGRWDLSDRVSGNRYGLNKATLLRGLEAVFKSHHRTMSELIECTVTARSGDILIQCAIFGHVLYVRDAVGNLLHVCPLCRFAPCRCKAARDITERDTMRP